MAEGRRSGNGRRSRGKFNLGIVGRSNSGKSSLIKLMLQSQLGPENGDLPKTDFLECTEKREKFEIPGCSIVLWDVPGVGTQNEGLEGYDERIEIEKYDGFVVCCGGPVTEYELALNNLIASHGRRYIFVRTKVDAAIENEKKAHPSTFDEEETLQKLRDGINEKLSESGVNEFLVSNRHPEKFDFETLKFIVFDKGALTSYMQSCNKTVKNENIKRKQVDSEIYSRVSNI